MTDFIKEILLRNQNWAKKIAKENPDFFLNLIKKHAPKLMWIGCSDARFSEKEVANFSLGEAFVHRNVGNIIDINDNSINTAIYFAINHLKVEHIIIAGHYGCGAIKSLFNDDNIPYVSDWLKKSRILKKDNEKYLSKFSQNEKENLMAEFNVKQQVETLSKFKIIQESWQNNSNLEIHGIIYQMHKGHLKDLNVTKNKDTF